MHIIIFSQINVNKIICLNVIVFIYKNYNLFKFTDIIQLILSAILEKPMFIHCKFVMTMYSIFTHTYKPLRTLGDLRNPQRVIQLLVT